MKEESRVNRETGNRNWTYEKQKKMRHKRAGREKERQRPEGVNLIERGIWIKVRF